MKTSIVKVSNSQGMRIPKPLLEQCGLKGEVQFKAKGHELVIYALRNPCQAWAWSFKKMTKQGDDQ